VAAAAPAISRSLPDVTVVGAGAFGAWTADPAEEKALFALSAHQPVQA